MRYLRETVPIVEQISIDEAFLDVSDDPRDGQQAALDMQATIRARFELPTSWGIASNKLVAKIATEVGKPNGMIVVPPGEESRFLAPLPVSMLWGVGPKSSQRLAGHGIRTIGDLANLLPTRLRELFGNRGTELAARAKGQDTRPVQELHERRSLSAERTFAVDIDSEDDLRRYLLRLSERVGSRLRKAEMAGSTIRIKLRWPDFTTITRQARLSQPTNQDGEIFEAAFGLLKKNWPRGRAVRLLGVGMSELGPPLRQLKLFDHDWEHDQRLLGAVDEIREKYGQQALRRAGAMSHGADLRAKDDTAR